MDSQGHFGKFKVFQSIYSVAFYDTQGDVEDLFYPGSSRVQYGMWGT
jgi:hypothetical protein